MSMRSVQVSKCASKFKPGASVTAQWWKKGYLRVSNT